MRNLTIFLVIPRYDCLGSVRETSTAKLIPLEKWHTLLLRDNLSECPNRCGNVPFDRFIVAPILFNS